VYLIVALPALTPEITPRLEIPTIEVLLLDQVPPPILVDKFAVFPTQIAEGPERVASTFLFTVIAIELSDEQFCTLVKVNVVVPSDAAVTVPELSILAISGLLLAQVPPEEGENEVVLPIQIAEGPVRFIEGLGLIVTGKDGFETQLVAALVKVKVAVPALIPVTSPVLLTVATPLLLLDHDPPVEGDNVVVDP
jgi:hypothetical protein